MRKKCPAEKKYPVFCLETLKNCILNEKFYPLMTTIRAFFLQIRVLFFQFSKKDRGDIPPRPLQLRACSVIDILKELLGISQSLDIDHLSMIFDLSSLIKQLLFHTQLTHKTIRIKFEMKVVLNKKSALVLSK